MERLLPGLTVCRRGSVDESKNKMRKRVKKLLEMEIPENIYNYIYFVKSISPFGYFDVNVYQYGGETILNAVISIQIIL